MIVAYITEAGANIHIPGQGMKKIASSSPIFLEVVSVVMDGIDLPPEEQLTDGEKINRIVRLIDREEGLRDAVVGSMEVIEGNIKIDGEFVPEIIAQRIRAFEEAKLPLKAIVSFWDNLKNNPDERCRNELLKFLEHNGIPLTDDGHFVAYKYVNADFGAIADSSYKNNPGNELSKNRRECDPNPNQTCSNGLHVASWGYVKDSKTIVAVKVNPIDVVAVPTDYNGQKMRVCRYRVLEQITGEFSTPRYETPEAAKVNYDTDRERFEFMGIEGFHKSNGFGTWAGMIKHKSPLLNGKSYHGDSLDLLRENFEEIITEITKDTRFNYLRQKRDINGGFLKVKGQ